MNGQQAINQYQRVNTQSSIDEASPHQLIAMLINGALSRLAFSMAIQRYVPQSPSLSVCCMAQLMIQAEYSVIWLS